MAPHLYFVQCNFVQCNLQLVNTQYLNFNLTITSKKCCSIDSKLKVMKHLLFRMLFIKMRR